MKRAVYVGFEADPDECARLNASARPRHRYIAAVLGCRSEPRTFHITRNLACASLLEPNHEFLSQFVGFADLFTVERTMVVSTIPLDACLAAHGIPRADFLELDTQGSELDILMGAERVLRETIVGVQAEVEFAPMYVRQPLFADIDAFLRARGFHLFDLSRYRARRAALTPTRGQLLWGHALYLKDHHGLDPHMSARLATIAALLDYPDLALEILGPLSACAPTNEQRRAASRAHAALLDHLQPSLMTRLIDRLNSNGWSAALRWMRGRDPHARMSLSRHRSTWSD